MRDNYTIEGIDFHKLIDEYVADELENYCISTFYEASPKEMKKFLGSYREFIKENSDFYRYMLFFPNYKEWKEYERSQIDYWKKALQDQLSSNKIEYHDFDRDFNIIHCRITLKNYEEDLTFRVYEFGSKFDYFENERERYDRFPYFIDDDKIYKVIHYFHTEEETKEEINRQKEQIKSYLKLNKIDNYLDNMVDDKEDNLDDEIEM